MLDFFDNGNQKNLTINFGATYLFHFTKTFLLRKNDHKNKVLFDSLH